MNRAKIIQGRQIVHATHNATSIIHLRTKRKNNKVTHENRIETRNWLRSDDGHSFQQLMMFFEFPTYICSATVTCQPITVKLSEAHSQATQLNRRNLWNCKRKNDEILRKLSETRSSIDHRNSWNLRVKRCMLIDRTNVYTSIICSFCVITCFRRCKMAHRALQTPIKSENMLAHIFLRFIRF